MAGPTSRSLAQLNIELRGDGAATTTPIEWSSSIALVNTFGVQHQSCNISEQKCNTSDRFSLLGKGAIHKTNMLPRECVERIMTHENNAQSAFFPAASTPTGSQTTCGSSVGRLWCGGVNVDKCSGAVTKSRRGFGNSYSPIRECAGHSNECFCNGRSPVDRSQYY